MLPLLQSSDIYLQTSMGSISGGKALDLNSCPMSTTRKRQPAQPAVCCTCKGAGDDLCKVLGVHR